LNLLKFVSYCSLVQEIVNLDVNLKNKKFITFRVKA
jgi:hypothetical protein